MADDDLIGEEVVLKIFAALAREVHDDNLDNEISKVGSLPQAVRAIYTTTTADDQILNGGFHQYFWNPSGAFAEEAAEDFALIGDQKRAEIVKSAIRILFAEKNMQLKARRDGSLKAFSDAAKESQLRRVDGEYCAMQFVKPLDDLLAAHIRRNIQLFEPFK